MNLLFNKSSAWVICVHFVTLIVILLGLGGCGGGGSAGMPDTAAAYHQAVSLVSITFPEHEDLTGSTAIPPLAAPLSQQIVFTFTGPVEGLVDPSAISIYSEVEPDYSGPTSLVDPEKKIIRAQGTYEQFSNIVVFKPKLVTQAIDLSLNAGDEKIPGLLPDREYKIFLPVGGDGAILNLVGIHNQIHLPISFKTTGFSQLYYQNFSDQPPGVTGTTPAEGSIDIPVNTLAVMAGITPLPGMSVAFDSPLDPSEDNLSGYDGDGDGIYEPNLFFRYRDPFLFAAADPTGNLLRIHGEDPSDTGGYETLSFELNGESISFSQICLDHAGRMTGLSEGVFYQIEYKDPHDLVLDVQELFDTGIPQLKGLAMSWDGLFYSVDSSCGDLVSIDLSKAALENMGSLVDGENAYDLVFGHDDTLYLLRQENSTSGNAIAVVEQIEAKNGTLISEVSRFPGA
ncbi:MAG: hypothetical protein ABIK28_06020, partial [Planctomycetota bacterium]